MYCFFLDSKLNKNTFFHLFFCNKMTIQIQYSGVGVSELDLEGHLVAGHVVLGVAQLEGSHEADEELFVLFVVHQLHLRDAQLADLVELLVDRGLGAAHVRIRRRCRVDFRSSSYRV